jgi:hypothetical protein
MWLKLITEQLGFLSASRLVLILLNTLFLLAVVVVTSIGLVEAVQEDC